jgi:hypothetical protein
LTKHDYRLLEKLWGEGRMHPFKLSDLAEWLYQDKERSDPGGAFRKVWGRTPMKLDAAGLRLIIERRNDHLLLKPLPS